MSSIVESARVFIDATASLLADEGYVLSEEVVPYIGTSSVVRSSAMVGCTRSFSLEASSSRVGHI